MSYNFTSGSTTHIGDFTALGFVKAKSDEVSGSTVVVGGGGLSIAGVAVSATATELNILDGVTSTTAELNILDGVTATAAELNILDGVTSTTAELNILDGVTATAAELNLIDGSSAGAVVNSKAVIYNASGKIKAAGYLNSSNAEVIDADGNIDAASLSVGGSAITSTPAEINLLDGAAANTIANSKAVIYGSSGEIKAGAISASSVSGSGAGSFLSLNIASVAVSSTAAELNLLDGSSAATVVNSKAVIYGSSGEVNATTLQIGGVSISATAAELNIMDGVTATTAELNIMDGVTATTAELNIMDGNTSASSTTVADGDAVVMNDGGTMKQVTVQDLAAYLDDEITAMPNLIAIGAAGATTQIDAGDITMYNDVTDGNPSISLGSSATEAFVIQAKYGTGAKNLNEVIFESKTAASDADAGMFQFRVDEADLLFIDDGGLQLGGGGKIGPLSDSDLLSLSAQSLVIASDAALTYKGTAITATGAELNILDGVTATTAELNILDGVTSTAAELNFLDGFAEAEYDQTADSVAFFDATDSKIKYEGANDFVGKIAGSGLIAESGKLKLSTAGVATVANGGTLSEGFNRFAALSDNATVSLPASSGLERGDVIYVKANTLSGAKITIQVADSSGDLIDGQGSIEIQSSYGAVSLVKLADNVFGIF